MSKKIICCMCGHNQTISETVIEDIYFPNRMVRIATTEALVKCDSCGRYEDMIIFGENSFSLLGKDNISDADKKLAKLSNVIFYNKRIAELEIKLFKENTKPNPSIRQLEYDIRYHREALIINQNC